MKKPRTMGPHSPEFLASPDSIYRQLQTRTLLDLGLCGPQDSLANIEKVLLFSFFIAPSPSPRSSSFLSPRCGNELPIVLALIASPAGDLAALVQACIASSYREPFTFTFSFGGKSSDRSDSCGRLGSARDGADGNHGSDSDGNDGSENG